MSPGEAVSSKAEQRQQLGQVGQPFGLPTLSRREVAALALAIEQRLQAIVNPGGQTKML